MKRWFLLFLVLTCVAAACKKDQNPGYKASAISTDTGMISFPAGSATEQIQLLSDGGWYFEGPEWIKAYPSSGYGDCKVEISVEANLGEDGSYSSAREAEVSFRSTRTSCALIITQGGAVTAADFLSMADETTVYWQVSGTVKSVEDWTFGRLTVEDASGTLPVFNFLDSSGRNKHFSEMNVYPGDDVTIYGFKSSENGKSWMYNARVLSIVRKGMDIDPADPVNVSQKAQTIQVKLTGVSSVTATSSASWLVPRQPVSSDGGLTVEVAVSENTVETSRKGLVTFEGGGVKRALTVSQGAFEMPIYMFAISSTSETVGAESGETVFYISADKEVSYDMTADEGLTLSASSGSGNGTYTVAYTANPYYEPRTLRVTVTSRTVYVSGSKSYVFSIEQQAKERPESNVFAKWYTDEAHMAENATYFGGVPDVLFLTLEAGDGGQYINANEGNGKITYYQVDKSSLSGVTNTDGVILCGRGINGKGGYFKITGGYDGDYWLITVPGKAKVEAGTRVHVAYSSQSSAGGMKLWMVEYLDGDTWIPGMQTKTATRTNFPEMPVESVDYNLMMVDASTYSKVDFTFTLTHDMDEVFIRQRVVVPMNNNGASFLGKTNGGRNSLHENIVVEQVFD